MSIYDRFGGVMESGQPLIDVPQVETAYLRAASPYLLNPMGAPQIPGCTDATQQPWASGVRQPFPATAVSLISALGATGVILPANVLAIYQCDTATPLVDSLGLGPNLVAAGGPLTGRECVGLPDATFASKVGCELLPATLFQSAAAAFANVNANTLSVLAVLRFNPNAAGNGEIIGKIDAAPRGWMVYWNTINLVWHVDGATTCNVQIAWPADGSWQCFAVVVDEPALAANFYTSLGDAAGAYTGSANNAVAMCIGTQSYSAAPCQLAYLAFLDVALTSAQRATFWRAFNPAGLGTPNTYARLNPLVVPISSSRVACYGAGQMAVGYSAGLVSAALGNALGTGIVAEDGATFEPIGSDNYFGNTATVGAAAIASVDGASGMRDGMRITMGAAWAGGWASTPGAGCAIVGASNIPWQLGIDYRRATVGTTGKALLYFQGDAGGPESFFIVNDPATPVDWARTNGNCTPTRVAHNIFYVIIGATNNLDDCDFAEPAVIKNRTTAPLAWRRVGTAAAAATSTPTLSMVNTANSRYSPIRGRARINISGFQGTSGAVFLDCAVAGTAGSLQLNYNAGQLILRIWDSTPALVAAVNCGALGTGAYVLDALWDARVPIIGNAVGGHMIVKQGSTILGEGGAAWVPPTADVTPIAVGVTVGGTGAARCFIALASLSSLPGSVYD